MVNGLIRLRFASSITRRKILNWSRFKPTMGRMMLGEEGTEQFTVTTRVNGELIKAQPIHDPFVRTRVTLKGWGHAWRALFGGICVQVAVDGSHGAQAAIMTLDPKRLDEETQIFIERQVMRRAENDAAGVIGYYAEKH
jgi:hypothetical protein